MSTRQRRRSTIAALFAAALALILALPSFASAAPFGTITKFSQSTNSLGTGAQPLNFATGSDDNVWFTDNSNKGIFKITPGGVSTRMLGRATGDLTEGSTTVENLVVTGGNFPVGSPIIAVSLSGGALPLGTRVTACSPSCASPTSLTLSAAATATKAGAQLYATTAINAPAIAAGPDGNLWFTENNFGGTGAAIDRLTTAGQRTIFPLATATDSPVDIAAGPDGNLWFTKQGATPAIGKITPSGAITEYTIGLQAGNKSRPAAITAGPDGNVWFADASASAGGGGINELGKVDLSTEPPTITEYSAGLNAGSKPGNGTGVAQVFGLAPGPDGNVWFTDNGTTKAIGKITPSGTITEYSAGLLASSQPKVLTAGPEGNLWFTDQAGVNEKQQIEVSATESLGGHYKLTFGGQTTGWTGKGTLTEGSTTVSGLEHLTGSLVFNEEISGEGIPVGTTVTACSPSCGPNATSLTLSAAVEAGKSAAAVSLSADLSANIGTETQISLEIKEALERLSSVGAGNVVVSNNGSIPNVQKRVVEFKTALASTDVESIACNPSGLTGTSPSCAVATTKAGVSHQVGSITTAGVIAEHSSPSAGGAIQGITLGSDGNLWYGEAETVSRFWIKPGPANRRTLTLTKTPAGNAGGGLGSVSSKPKGIKCAQTCNKAVGHFYKNATVVLTEAPSGELSKFKEWTGACSGSGTTCTVEMNEAKEVGAVFEGTSKPFSPAEALTFSKGESESNFGYGTVKASGLTCEAECDSTAVLYQGPITEPKPKAGKTVELKEVPAFGSKFVGWSGACSGIEPTCKVEMSEAKSVTAEFTALPNKALTVKKAYAGGLGSVSSKPKGISCGTTCTQTSAKMPEGSSVVLTEKPANLETTFVKWEGGDCEGLVTTTCTVTMNEAETVKAVFSGPVKAIAEPKTLTLSKEGSGYGTVKASGLTCEALCTGATSLYYGPVTEPKIKAGAKVILKALSAPGSKAVEWTGCTPISATECEVVMETNASVTAKFDELE